MRSCDDGYPGCRHAEETGEWCKGDCRASMQKELDALLEKREQVRAKQMERMHSGGMTRARTTTSNAEADRLNERIVWLREQLKKPNVEVSGLRGFSRRSARLLGYASVPKLRLLDPLASP